MPLCKVEPRTSRKVSFGRGARLDPIGLLPVVSEDQTEVRAGPVPLIGGDRGPERPQPRGPGGPEVVLSLVRAQINYWS